MYRVTPEGWNNHPILKKAIDILVRNISRSGLWKKLGMRNPSNPESAAPPEEIKKMVVKFLSSGNVKAGKMFASNLLVDKIDGYDEPCEDLGGPSKYSPEAEYKCLKRSSDYSDKEFLKGFVVQYQRALAMYAPLEETKTTLSKSHLIKIIKEEVENILQESDYDFDMLKDDDVLKVGDVVRKQIVPAIKSKLGILKAKNLKPSEVASKMQMQVINSLRAERFIKSEKIKQETENVLARSNALKMPSSVAGPVK